MVIETGTHGFDALLARGIDRATLLSADVTPGDDGYWWYPVYDAQGRRAGWRGKRMSAGTPKYRWADARAGACDVLYGAERVVAGQNVLLCEGEPDTWLMWSAGFPACCMLGGAGTVKVPAIADLARRRPSRVLVVYDVDEAGRAGAVRATRALRDAGLCADALALPDDLGHGGDVTDLWTTCGQDRERFVRALAACPRLPIPAPPPPRVVTSKEERWTLDREAFNQQHDLADLVARVAPLKRRGGVYVARCPLPGHDDDTASFVVYEQPRPHFFCFGCHQSGDAWWLARSLQLVAS